MYIKVICCACLLIDECTITLVCKNGGFLNFQCKCYCPYGLTGETCETVINDDGKIIKALQ